MSVELPKVTVLVPVLNEQGFIVECLNSVLNGSYPSENLEILVIDGRSTDGTQQEILMLSSLHSSIKLVDNPKKIVPAALNIGIKKASHEIIIWLGAHAVYDSEYLLRSVETLLEENCASVGGVITPKGKSYIGRAIALATTSKFGIGNAKYRHANQRQEVDTVFGGCWKKDSITRIGGFNESWVRNQDYEVNYRLRKEIGPIILEPSIRCIYYCRESIKKLAKQYYQYGFWRFNTIKKHPKSFTIRQAAPVMLFAGIVISIALALYNSNLALIIPTIYLSLAIVFAINIGIKNKWPNLLLLLPIIFSTLHLSWALGFFMSALSSLIYTTKSKLTDKA